MYDIKNWEEKLLADIGEKRFNHCLRVVDTALKLNKSLDEDLVKTAALLHDCAKNNEDKFLALYGDKIDEDLLAYKAVIHSFLGAEVAKKVYNVSDEKVLAAIKYHTTGKADMDELEKIIYLADAIEPKRDYPGVEEIRKLAKDDIDEAILYSLDHNIEFLISKGALIHPLTLAARNYLLKEKND